MKLKHVADISQLDVNEIDISDIKRIHSQLPSGEHSYIDINIAERGMRLTLDGVYACQEKIVKIDRGIGVKESEKNRAWSRAALDGAANAGYKTAKDRENYAMGDDDYIQKHNELLAGKAFKKYLENAMDLFKLWHFTFKEFLRRDIPVERMSVAQPVITGSRDLDDREEENMCGEVDWAE
jgi:hypothetical protein